MNHDSFYSNFFARIITSFPTRNEMGAYRIVHIKQANEEYNHTKKH